MLMCVETLFYFTQYSNTVFLPTQQNHNLLSERFKPVCHSKKSVLQHLLDGVEKQCDDFLKEFDESIERMRLAGLQYANG